jgi:hypothetical protein
VPSLYGYKVTDSSGAISKETSATSIVFGNAPGNVQIPVGSSNSFTVRTLYRASSGQSEFTGGASIPTAEMRLVVPPGAVTNIAVLAPTNPPGYDFNPDTRGVFISWTPPTNTGGGPIVSYTVSNAISSQILECANATVDNCVLTTGIGEPSSSASATSSPTYEIDVTANNSPVPNVNPSVGTMAVYTWHSPSTPCTGSSTNTPNCFNWVYPSNLSPNYAPEATGQLLSFAAQAFGGTKSAIGLLQMIYKAVGADPNAYSCLQSFDSSLTELHYSNGAFLATAEQMINPGIDPTGIAKDTVENVVKNYVSEGDGLATTAFYDAVKSSLQSAVVGVVVGTVVDTFVADGMLVINKVGAEQGALALYQDIAKANTSCALTPGYQP